MAQIRQISCIIFAMIQFDEDKQRRKLDELLHKEEEDLVQILSAKYGVEYVNLLGTPVNTDALRLIPEEIARPSQVAAYALIDKKVKIAARNPQDEKVVGIMKDIETKGYQPELYITSTQGLEKAWKVYKDLSFAYESKAGSLEISSEEIAAIIDQAKSLPTIISILNNTMAAKKSYRISRILETVVAGALAIDASDIHLEPEEAYVQLRYRLDGVLQEVLRFDNETYGLILSRIKLISGMKLNVKKDSQDGRFSIRLPIGDVEVRVSILPGAYNESIVMRLLNPKSIDVPLESLGINKKLLDILLKEIDRPDGMILTTGPTGSGKTTTLYSFLKKIHDPKVKIITIEDPIEYHLPGIVQTQVNDKGYNFAEGLRAAVRQDPDIIMIGEIRDNETAEAAIQSASTGHLVLSTLHANSAAGTVSRIIKMNVSPDDLANASNLFMAQRLVRQLCNHCKQESVPTTEELSLIESAIASISPAAGIDIPASRKIWRAGGCPTCNGTGYTGRMTIMEALPVGTDIQELIGRNALVHEIEEKAVELGMVTMAQDGVLAVLESRTSIEEVRRVTEI